MRRDLVVAILAVLALFAVSLLGRHDESPPGATHASGDDGAGGYRAWYELLAREGVHVERFRHHHDDLRRSGIDTLILAFPSGRVSSLWNAAERDALRAWVRGGGRLVDVGVTPSVDQNDARDERVVLDGPFTDRGPLYGSWAPFVRVLAERGTMRLVVRHARVKTPPRGRGGARVETPLRDRNDARLEKLLRDSSGALAVRYTYGRGQVVGIATGVPFENRFIGREDAARLAYLLARPRGGGTVAFDEAVRGDIAEKPWYRALTAPELVALALAALAGLLWLAYGIVPLGPSVRLRAPREPASDEFVDAVAALYERARARDHARDALLRDARRSLERAPRTPENEALAQRVEAARNQPLSDDAALVAVARLARLAREETIRATSPDRRRAPSARGAGARRRRR